MPRRMSGFPVCECGENVTEQAGHVLAGHGRRVGERDEGETVEFGDGAAAQGEEAGAAQPGGIGHARRAVGEEGEALARHVAENAERDEAVRRKVEAGFLAQFAGGGGGVILARFGLALWDVPAGGARCVAEQEMREIGGAAPALGGKTRERAKRALSFRKTPAAFDIAAARWVPIVRSASAMRLLRVASSALRRTSASAANRCWAWLAIVCARDRASASAL